MSLYVLYEMCYIEMSKTCYGSSTCKIWLKMNNKRLLNIMLRQLQKLLFLLFNISLILTLPWKGLQLKVFSNQ